MRTPQAGRQHPALAPRALRAAPLRRRHRARPPLDTPHVGHRRAALRAHQRPGPQPDRHQPATF
eukprot:12876076-Alexandrium_andersonii.AAC.1